MGAGRPKSRDTICLDPEKIKGNEDKMLEKVLKEMSKNPDNEVVKIRLAVLLRAKANNENLTISEMLERYTSELKGCINEKDITKLLALNKLILKYKNTQSKIYETFKKLLNDSDITASAMQYYMSWLDNNGILTELEDKLDEIFNTGDFFGNILEFSQKTKTCTKCGEELHISNYSLGKSKCKTCTCIDVSKRKYGEDGERLYRERKIKDKVKDNIEEFKTESHEIEDLGIKQFREYSGSFINISSQIRTLEYNIDELCESNFNSITCDESHELSLMLIQVHKKLLNMEERLHEYTQHN